MHLNVSDKSTKNTNIQWEYHSYIGRYYKISSLRSSVRENHLHQAGEYCERHNAETRTQVTTYNQFDYTMYDFVISRQQFPKVKWPKMSQSYQLLRSRLPEANDRCQNNRKANPIWTWVLVTFSFCLLTVLYNQQPHYHSHLAKNDINYKIHSGKTFFIINNK